MASLAQKLAELGKGLSSREKWFLGESLKGGIMAKHAEDVTGFTMSSALEGGTMYYPTAYQQTYGNGQTLDSVESLGSRPIVISIVQPTVIR